MHFLSFMLTQRTLSALESRLAKLEAIRQAPPRGQYTDMERAIRCAYLLEQGGPDADKLQKLLYRVPDESGEQ